METDEILDDTRDNALKERHGCVTAWLIFMMIGNGAIALSYLLATDQMAETLSDDGADSSYIIMLGLVGLANLTLAIMLFKWMKSAFYGFVGTTAISFVINMMLGLGLVQSILGFLGIAVLYGILQISKDGKSAWSLLE